MNRQFDPDGPNRLWVMDVTEHATAEGKVYLAAVIDAWSRRVVGWSIADHIRAELVADALQMATGDAFFSILQRELLDQQQWATRNQLTTATFERIEA